MIKQLLGIAFMLVMFLTVVYKDVHGQVYVSYYKTTIEATRNLTNADEKSIFDIKVSTQAQGKNDLVLFLYIDGVYQQEYRKQTFPAVIQYNFRGMHLGKHEVRVDVVDFSNNERVVGRASAFVDV